MIFCTVLQCILSWTKIISFSSQICNKSNTTVAHVEQELITFLDHQSSPPVFSGGHVTYVHTVDYFHETYKST